jgi:sterol desaturase/sphingolipid hydroxylase (fatty acid hydroxylase superfamily)
MLYVASFAANSHEISWGLFVVTLLAADLSFYVYHAAAHHIRLLWADHSVHHTSGELDFSTNLRNSLFNGLYSWLPIMPVLLLGVNPYLVAVCRTLVNDYPFLLHTRHVKKLGWPVELIFNTPSHHRVHHACNAQYLNKNFAGIFIIWDRLFGTFAEEQAACTYGTTQKVDSKNPLKILFHEWRQLGADLISTPGFWNKARALSRTTSRS